MSLQDLETKLRPDLLRFCIGATEIEEILCDISFYAALNHSARVDDSFVSVCGYDIRSLNTLIAIQITGVNNANLAIPGGNIIRRSTYFVCYDDLVLECICIFALFASIT